MSSSTSGTTTSTRNSKWPDQSGFSYDLAPVDAVRQGTGAGKAVYRGNPEVYELGDILFELKSGQYNSWTNWIEKFQPDYRFATISDKNAETYLFPNVDDPWMFTEYIFEGKDSSTIIEPDLYDSETLEPINSVESKRVNPHGWQKEESSSSAGTESTRSFDFFTRDGESSSSATSSSSTSSSSSATIINDFPTDYDGIKLYKKEMKVQCVKWGEHGNIPPHTLNMTAPRSWFEPEGGMVTMIVPVITMSRGSPAYANLGGSNSGEITIDSSYGDMTISSPLEYSYVGTYEGGPVDESSSSGYDGTNDQGSGEWNSVWSYEPSSDSEETKQAKPHSWRYENSRTSGQGLSGFVGSSFITGDIIHEGCQFWKTYYLSGSSSKVVMCELARTLEEGTRETLKPVPSSCQSTNNECPFYVQRSIPVEIGTFETQAANNDEWAKQYAGIKNYNDEGGASNFVDSNSLMEGGTLPLGGGALFYGAASLGALGALKSEQTTLPRKAGEYDIRWTITFEVRTVPMEGKQVEYIGGRSVSSQNSDKYLRIKRNTGAVALDKYEEAPYGGVDPIFYGDINQLSFTRWMTSVMHCQNCSYCNSIYGIDMQDGYDPLNMAGGDGACRYYLDWKDTPYGGGCPYNGVPKRAYEFQKKYSLALERLYPLFSLYAQAIQTDNTSFSFLNMWFESGGSWYIGKGPYQALCYVNHSENPYPHSMPSDSWVVVDRGSFPAPDVVYDGNSQTITIENSGVEEANGEYQLYGSYKGKAVFNKMISSSSSSNSSSEGSISSFSFSSSSSSSSLISSSSTMSVSSNSTSSNFVRDIWKDQLKTILDVDEVKVDDFNDFGYYGGSSSSAFSSSSSTSSNWIDIEWKNKIRNVLGFNDDREIKVDNFDDFESYYENNDYVEPLIREGTSSDSSSSSSTGPDGGSIWYDNKWLIGDCKKNKNYYEFNDSDENFGNVIDEYDGRPDESGSSSGGSSTNDGTLVTITQVDENDNVIEVEVSNSPYSFLNGTYSYVGKYNDVYCYAMDICSIFYTEATYTPNPNNIEAYNFGSIGSINFLEDDEEEEPSRDVYTLLSIVDQTDTFGGINCHQKHDDTNYIVARFLMRNKTIPEENEEGEVEPVEKEFDSAYVFIDALDNDGNEVDDSPWCVKLEPGFVEAEGFAIDIDNENSFNGGHYPEYKDLTKRGDELVQEIGSGDGLQGESGVGDSRHWQPREPGILFGYWVDKGGEWILDGRNLGTNTISIDARLSNNPTYVGEATPIGGIPGTTIMDMATGQRVAPYIRACNIYSSDTDDVLQSDEIQELENDAGKSCPPRYESDGLPRERYGWYDSVNKITMHGECYGEPEDGVSPSGDDAEVSPWGGELVYQKLTQFPIVKAIGKVSVWGLPGMVVKGDAFYWKNPTLISNALLRQMRFKLGESRKESDDDGGGYSYAGLNESSVPKPPEGKGYYRPFKRDFVPDGIMGEEEDDSDGSYGWGGITDEEYFKFFSYNKMMEQDELGTDNFVSDNFDGSNVDDRFISPYYPNDGLKIVSIRDLKQARNLIQPVLGYLIGKTPGAKDYYKKKFTFENRKYPSGEKDFIKKAGTVEPEVMAACDGPVTSGFIQYWDGNLPGTTVREYTPVGVEYWRLYNLIGGYSRKGGDTSAHMDNSSDSDIIVGYHGDKLVSKAMFFLHGYLPLDKEILKAYAIFSPKGSPDFPSIGVTWSGRRIRWHYHPFSTGHEGAGLHMDYELGGDLSLAGDVIDIKEEHDSEEGDLYPKYHKKIPEQIVYRTNEEIKLLDDEKCGDQWFSSVDWNFDGMMTRMSHYDDSGSHGRSDPWNYINWGGFGNDMTRNYTEYEMWKHYSFERFNDLLDKYSSKCEISAELEEKKQSYDFKQMSFILLDYILPEQIQSIPGMFDFNGMNSAKRQPKRVNIADKRYDDSWQHGGQIIVQSDVHNDKSIKYKQDDDDSSLDGDNSGNDSSDGNNNAGDEPRVLDITGIVKDAYNLRVDRTYTVRTGGSISDLLDRETYPESNWTGSISEPAWSEDERELWNYRIMGEGDATDEETESGDDVHGVGYLLSDNFHYPKLVNDEIFVSEYGEKIELDLSVPFVIGSVSGPFTFDVGGSNTFSFDVYSPKGDSGSSVTIDVETTFVVGSEPASDGEFVLTTDEVVGQITDSLSSGDDDYIDVYNENGAVKIEGKSPYMNIANANIGMTEFLVLGFNEETINSTCSRVIDETKSHLNYTPSRMLASIFVKEDVEDEEPLSYVKNDNPTKWFYKERYNGEQSFIVDLVYAPLEQKRRNWRSKRPTYNCANAICPNKDCRIGRRGMTVLEWNEYLQSGVRPGPIPSYSATHCCSCGTSFLDESGEPKDGVDIVLVGGDGIYSYFYEDVYEYNPVIGKIVLDTMGDDAVLTASKSSFSVQVMNDLTNVWVPIVTVNYNYADGKFYWTWNGEDKSGDTPDTSFDLINAGMNIRARYVKVSSYPVRRQKIYSGEEGEKLGRSKYKIDNDGVFDEDHFVDAILTIADDDEGTNEETYKVISSDGTTLFVDDIMDTERTFWELKTIEYRGGVQSLEVYGSHYTSSELTVTGPPQVETMPYSNRVISLSEQPTKILKVYGGDSSKLIELTEADTKEDSGWTTITNTIGEDENGEGGTDYKVVESGKYYYDHMNNALYIDTSDQDGDDVTILNIAIPPETIGRRTMISKIIVEYMVGAGASVDLSFVADGNGPSYQVEKDCICEFEDGADDDFPDMGESVKLPDSDGTWEKRTLSWLVYNHDPAYGEFNNNNYRTGLELGTDWSYDSWLKIFGKQASNIGGTVAGTVTLYGLPDSVISGDFKVKAPATKEHSFTDGDGDSVSFYERTGGLSKTGILLGVELDDIDEDIDQGRKTFAWDVPTVIVYARERDITESINDDEE